MNRGLEGLEQLRIVAVSAPRSGHAIPREGQTQQRHERESALVSPTRATVNTRPSADRSEGEEPQRSKIRLVYLPTLRTV